MSFPGQEDPDRPPGEPQRRGPSPTRILIWVVVGGIAIYLIINGVIGVVQKGG
jgi:hypothetical protein